MLIRGCLKFINDIIIFCSMYNPRLSSWHIFLDVTSFLNSSLRKVFFVGLFSINLDFLCFVKIWSNATVEKWRRPWEGRQKQEGSAWEYFSISICHVILFFFYSFSLGKTGGISLILFSNFSFSSIFLRLIHQADGKNRKDQPVLFPFKSSFILASPRINFWHRSF